MNAGGGRSFPMQSRILVLSAVGLGLYSCEWLSILRLSEPFCSGSAQAYYGVIYVGTVVAALVCGFLLHCSWRIGAGALMAPPLLMRHAAFWFESGPSNLWPPVLLADLVHFGVIAWLFFVVARLRDSRNKRGAELRSAVRRHDSSA